MNLKLTYLPLQIFGKIWASLYISFPGNGGSADATQDFAPAKTGFQLQS